MYGMRNVSDRSLSISGLEMAVDDDYDFYLMQKIIVRKKYTLCQICIPTIVQECNMIRFKMPRTNF